MILLTFTALKKCPNHQVLWLWWKVYNTCLHTHGLPEMQHIQMLANMLGAIHSLTIISFSC